MCVCAFCIAETVVIVISDNRQTPPLPFTIAIALATTFTKTCTKHIFLRLKNSLECPHGIAAFAALVVAHEGVEELVVGILYSVNAVETACPGDKSNYQSINRLARRKQ